MKLKDQVTPSYVASSETLDSDPFELQRLMLVIRLLTRLQKHS